MTLDEIDAKTELPWENPRFQEAERVAYLAHLVSQFRPDDPRAERARKILATLRARRQS